MIDYNHNSVHSVQFSHSVMSDSVTPWTAAGQAFLSITNPWNLLKLMSIESAMPSKHLVPCLPLLLLPSNFPSIRDFFNQSALHISGQSTVASASASVLLMDIQDWFPLWLMGLISLQSKGLSRIFFSPQFESINSLMLFLLYGPTLTSIYDCWKNHSFD